jgi:alpha-mannosidase
VNRQAYIVSHTHWDREWYQTFHRFQVQLVENVRLVLDRLETDPHFKHFILDGQACLLEDFIQAAPEEEKRLRKLVSRGALGVGPWYILPDEFLVSGEATVRNLIYGRITCRRWGRAQRVGYMPDSFGHIAQMPQLLRLAGIDSFIFTRGLGSEAEHLGWLFQWGAPDTTEVLAVNQCDGYCNAGALGHEELWHAHTRRGTDPARAVEKMEALLDRMDTRPGHDPILLNNGCDHFPPQRNLGEMMAALSQKWPDTVFKQTRFEDFLKAARASCHDDDRPQWVGEMLGGRDHPILSGVWSTRMYLKQQNEICQNLLTRQVEPLCAAAHFTAGNRWPGGLLDQAWRQLLRNHPHDSICGCSTDAVHQDMESRFAAVIQTGEQVLSRLMDGLSPAFGRQPGDDLDTVITVANPLPVIRDEVVERLIVLPLEGLDLDHLQLLDDQGRPVPFRILETHYLERFWGIDYRSELFAHDQLDLLDTYLHRFGDRIVGHRDSGPSHDAFLLVQFLARDLPAVGHRQFRVVDQAKPAQGTVAIFQPVTARREGDEALLENQHLQVRLHPDGTFDLTDKATGRQFPGLNLLEDTEDRGDEYDYCPAETSLSVFSAGAPGKVRLTSCSDLSVSAEAAFRFDLPRSLEKDRRSRFPRTTPCDTVVRLVLRTGSRRLDVETSFNNRAFDHRLRAWFPTGVKTDQVVSDGHFMVNRRPLERTGGPDWVQPAPATWPQQDWSALHDDQGGLAIFNRGLPEFQTWSDPHSGAIFALTLLRCVDWLSRDDLPTRNHLNAGPTLHTPGAQCIGRQVFRYAIAPFLGNVLEADLPGESNRYRVDCLTHHGVRDLALPGGRSFLRKTDPRVQITAIKRSDSGDHLVVRLANLSGDDVSEILEFGQMVVDAEKTSFLDGPLDIENEEVFVSDGGEKLKVPLEPYEIANLIVELDKG